MATFAGTDALNALRTGRVARLSPSIDAGSHWSWASLRGMQKSSLALDTQDADGQGHHLVSIVHWPEIGHVTFVNDIWDKILLVPQTRNLGLVGSPRDFMIEVWSTFRSCAQTLTRLSTSGPGNLTISDPWGEPLLYQPGQSRTYAGLAPGAGDPTISTTVTFTFAALQPVAATITGMRLFVFWPQPDWSETPKETPQWKTEILKAVSTAEQRIKLRPVPRYQLSYRIVSDTPQRTARLEAQLFAGQTSLWGVPWWPESSDLLAQASAGTRMLTVDTTDRPTFEAGGLVLLWRDPDTWEAVLVESVASQSVGLGAALEQTWPIGTRVVPMRQGYMATELPLDRPTNWVTAAPFQFDCEIP